MNAVWLALSPPSRIQTWVEFGAVLLLLIAVGALAVTCERVPEPARPARKPETPAPGKPPGRTEP